MDSSTHFRFFRVGSFHPKDIERVKTNNFYVEKYLIHNDLDMKLSLQLLWDILVWRKNFGVNEINESNIRMDYLNQGLVFPRNRDKDGKTLLIFKAKLHVKGSKDMKELMRVVVYWIERVLAENDEDKMSAFFDMQGTSVGNVDMDLIKNIIEIFKLYPLPLNYILIYELPWLLNAAFKIIKQLMPPKAVEVMKFLNPKNVSEFVDDNNRLACWGGNDNYTFSFQPAQQKVSSNQAKQNLNNNNDEDFNLSTSTKKVHFANSSPTRSPMSDGEDHLTPNNEEMLRITPNDVIVLNKIEDSNEGELRGSVNITCTSKYPITYKIKTTAPLKFRVRPSSGALNPGCTATVYVILQPGNKVSSSSKDKFLVMCTPLPDDMDVNNSDMLAGFWKALPPNSPNVQQHRLQCICPQSSQGNNMHNGHAYSEDVGDGKNISGVDLVQLSETIKRIDQRTRLSVNLHWLSLMVFIIVSIALTYIIKQEIQGQNSDSCSKRF
ncbi:motile sperm domain-containing protein 2-like isoform X2 [Episyrphus balteatus]|uniref:motile sperm domain-containing protein 2-like isoform X2 n=1 Tax=Episyrphus balteatus TaxID=286459 RepID=UPI0024866718|nr:motile sperm domain-containing protein 2-like isoform X2 [Episyrphus balteatus]